MLIGSLSAVCILLSFSRVSKHLSICHISTFYSAVAQLECRLQVNFVKVSHFRTPWCGSDVTPFLTPHSFFCCVILLLTPFEFFIVLWYEIPQIFHCIVIEMHQCWNDGSFSRHFFIRCNATAFPKVICQIDKISGCWCLYWLIIAKK